MKNYIIKIYAVIISVIIVTACGNYDYDVEKALRYATGNRSELESVLHHYRKVDIDEQKFKAACYLIKHMPYHRSYPAEAYAEYCREMDSLFRDVEKGDTTIAAKATSVSKKYEERLAPIFDILEIKADYLIHNIDYSFEQWQQSPFLQHLDFDMFCEYVLPYKCLEFQPMNNWKEAWRHQWRGELDQMQQIDELRNNVRRAVEAVTYFYRNSDSLKMEVRQISDMQHIDLLDINALASQPYGTCLERSRLGLMTCRSKNLPVSFDFTPNWADRGSPHYWNHIKVDRRRDFDYEPYTKYPAQLHYADNHIAKVFRLTYTPHPILLEAVESGERIPSSLAGLFMRDVTDEYGHTADISVPLNDNYTSDDSYAYLSVFNNSDWTPSDICRIKRGKANFSKVGLDILYIVMAYRDNILTPISDPFIVGIDKQLHPIKADTTHLQELRLHRKFPAFGHIYGSNRYKKIMGGLIEASNRADFKNAVRMCEFPQNHFLAGETNVGDSTKYRYWRLCSSSGEPTDFAEVYFYIRDSVSHTRGKLIYPNVPIRDVKTDTPLNVCDGDPLTNFTVENKDGFRWVGYDFGKPVSIERVAYVRRGDGNDICPDDEYELYYWSNDGWKLHEKQIAKNVYLDFVNLPSDGLYFIKGLSRGEQNRTFIYRNNQILWY
ncbi:MAG: hypothetical protein IJB87_03540 [Alistipes sp.]|nr:hypothetical protein [Alistipes sp.]